MNLVLKIFICTFTLFISTGLCAEKYNDQFGTTFNFKVKDGKAIITSFKGRTDRVRIPCRVQGQNGRTYAVETIDLSEGYQLYGYTYDTRVLQIEDGVEKIKKNCFSGFVNLREVFLPNSIVFIERDAFKTGKNISFPSIPSGVTASGLCEGIPFFPESIAQELPDPINIDDNHVMDLDSDNDIASTEQERVIGVAGESDVDKGIPAGAEVREKTFCLIIANEKYASSDTPDVTWANADGKTFYQYCRTTLGIPYENIRVVYNADYLTMKKQLNWLKMVANHYGADAKFIFYYAGHGAPDDSGKCYLIPRNGSVNDLTTGFSLTEIYDAVGNLGAQQTLVLVDACFSGTDRHDLAMVEGKRGIARVEDYKVTGNVVAITAASNSQTALAYDEKAHGLFTYFVLKALKERRGNITYGELYNYVKENVGGKAILLMDKEQTPSVNPGSLKNTWQNMKL